MSRPSADLMGRETVSGPGVGLCLESSPGMKNTEEQRGNLNLSLLYRIPGKSVLNGGLLVLGINNILNFSFSLSLFFFFLFPPFCWTLLNLE